MQELAVYFGWKSVAPSGHPMAPIVPNSQEWHEAFQWAISECKRLGLQFDMTFNFGYGCGGPWITPENSMQKLVWTEHIIEGGKQSSISLKKPVVDRSQLEKFEKKWIRHDEQLNPKVRYMLDSVDSYRDIAVLAFQLPETEEAANYRIPQLEFESGLKRNRKNGGFRMLPGSITPPREALISTDKVINITKFMDKTGQLNWDAPTGKWQIIRFGHESNLQLTRPCPAHVIGLECDRLSKTGIEAHFDAFMKKIIEESGSNTGKSLTSAHIDSWEAHAQNWTATFPEEFEERRGYSPIPWLPVLSGRVIGSPELSSRFLWDFRYTISEMMLDNFVDRFKKLLKPHGIKISIEAYGNMTNDNISYAGIADTPVSEFWAQGEREFPLQVISKYYTSSKVMSSASHTYGRRVTGSEAWTSNRGWRDHPYTLKALGDEMFCMGVNRMIGHLSVHQPYKNMVPGLTHRKWGMHFNRFNTWWLYSRPWHDYLSRCQFMLQQGEFVADVIYWFGEGSPINVNDMNFQIPKGYDFDYASTEIVQQIQVKDGNIVLPSGMCYKYLLLPDHTRITLSMMKKIEELVDAGAKVIAQKRFIGSFSLTDYPKGDEQIKKMVADLWDNHRVISGKTLDQVFAEDNLPPDFSGLDLDFIHRKMSGEDIYFVANKKNEKIEGIQCSFRVVNTTPELWNPETGEIRKLAGVSKKEGTITISLDFEPYQSWFVVFRKKTTENIPKATANFPVIKDLLTITGPWSVKFNEKWGGPKEAVVFDSLLDWSKDSNPGIHYYSGTAVYKREFEVANKPDSPTILDLGKVQIIARVRLNGKDCGIAWKPPYRVDISSAICKGKNSLEIYVVNTWVNRLIGDEQLPLDSDWKDWEILNHWPEWFLNNEPRPSGRFTFTSCRHYKKDSKLTSSGLLGPVKLMFLDE